MQEWSTGESILGVKTLTLILHIPRPGLLHTLLYLRDLMISHPISNSRLHARSRDGGEAAPVYSGCHHGPCRCSSLLHCPLCLLLRIDTSHGQSLHAQNLHIYQTSPRKEPSGQEKIAEKVISTATVNW